MAKEIGQYTKVADKIEEIIKTRDFATSDGEYTDLHTEVIKNIACDITNEYLRQEEAKKVNKIYLAIKKRDNSIFNVGGYFYHFLFKNVLDNKFEENYLIRFCKLCTYLNYDNILIQGNTKGQTKILEKDLEIVWNLSANEMIRTKKYLIENKLIYINSDGVITVNKKFAIRGKVDGDSNMARVFINGFNELYNGVAPRQHTILAIFIKMLPYLNNEFNILCENPNEKDKRLVKPLKWTEIGKLIGLTIDQTKKLKFKLFKLRINGKKVIAEWKDDDGAKIVVNPVVFWKSNESNISDIAKMFEI